MSAKIEALEGGWRRLPLAGEPVEWLSFDGTGKRPWVTLKLRDYPSLSLPYRGEIKLQIESAVDVSINPIDDASIETTFTPREGELLTVQHVAKSAQAALAILSSACGSRWQGLELFMTFTTKA